MEFERIAIIKTSELKLEQRKALKEHTYPAGHKGDLWMVQEPELRVADPLLADNMIQGGAKRALILDDVPVTADLEDLRATVAP